MAGKLILVPTPIGNLGDMTERAKAALRDADMIAAEDTRRTRELLNAYNIKNRLMSFHEHSTAERIEQILAMIREGATVALCSDAGTPIISDPGADIVAAAVKEDIAVESLPGACAAIVALTLSALDTRRFCFEGFLPRDNTRKESIERALNNGYTTVLYESPHHLGRTLAELAAIAPDRRICVLKELTKLHEGAFRGTFAEAAERFSEPQKGEFVLVIEGAKPKTAEHTDDELISEVSALIEKGHTPKDAVKTVAEIFGVNKNRVYKLYTQSK